MAACSLTTRWPVAPGPTYHFSVDDVFRSLIEVTDHDLPLFQHPFFDFLRALHEEFGSEAHLYVFYQTRVNGRLRTLRDVSASLAEAFQDSPWLHLGPHGLDYETPPYSQTPDEQIVVFDAIYAELDRFAAGGARAEWVRLHLFSESFELGEYFRARGARALLCTDREAVSYRLPPAARDRLAADGRVEHGGTELIRTHLRLERLLEDGVEGRALQDALDSLLSRYRLAVFMTHELEMERAEVRQMAASVLRHLRARCAVSV
jgi:hypothetical protein